MKNKLLSGGGVITALLASLCCITPVLAVLGGLGGIATTFSLLEPLRPYLIGLTVIVLGYAFYKIYKPKKNTDIDCACEDETSGKKVSFINSKKFLWIITVVSALLITFPYYSKALFPSQKENVIIVQSDNIVKAEIQIEGMTCTACENSVDYALKTEAGVIKASSSYKTGIAYVEYDQTKVNPDQLKKAIEEKVGYKVKDIEKINN
ncbi:MAG: mercuric transport protein MerTP [Ignavibacteria bacterium]|nr:mercuric transport protein MerTP [Ignavibacteria bacterium]